MALAQQEAERLHDSLLMINLSLQLLLHLHALHQAVLLGELCAFFQRPSHCFEYKHGFLVLFLVGVVQAEEVLDLHVVESLEELVL